MAPNKDPRPAATSGAAKPLQSALTYDLSDPVTPTRIPPATPAIPIFHFRLMAEAWFRFLDSSSSAFMAADTRILETSFSNVRRRGGGRRSDEERTCSIVRERGS